ncbi:hypothetical protein [Kordia sp.]|uniref:hypothetical protein n=1 Tax=Kordia sp. TaxID=1965332 RepID=UPI003B5AAACA
MKEKKEIWFPIALSDLEKEALNTLKSSMPKTPQPLDSELLEKVDKKVNILLKNNVDIIVARNSLPNLSHLICGWGNFMYDGAPVIEKMEDFIFYKNNEPYIKQCDPEGDFHPWQSLAYTSMAGVNFNEVKVKNYSLKDLAFNSVWINKNKGEELGHLLFAFANNYSVEDLSKIFYLNTEPHNLEQLIHRGIEAHDYGGFEVCRKFHLSEGLCAITAKVSDLEKYKPDAQRFLDGQTEMVGLIQLIFEQILNEDGDLSLLTSIRDKMVILSYFENHIYYLGHAIENACFGFLNGFEIDMVHYNLMIKTVNTANRFLYHFGLDAISFLESFLSLGHYRRASLLLLEISKHVDQNLNLDADFNINEKLKLYTVDLDAIDEKNQEESPKNEAEQHYKEYFLFSVKDYNVLPRLNEVLENEILKQSSLELKGGFEHFRRYHPNKWPRSVHFEIVQYKHDDSIGVELHIEDLAYKSLFSELEEIHKHIQANVPTLEVAIDKNWYNCGRIHMVYNKDVSTDKIIEDFIKLIAESQEKISNKIQKIAV